MSRRQLNNEAQVAVDQFAIATLAAHTQGLSKLAACFVLQNLQQAHAARLFLFFPRVKFLATKLSAFPNEITSGKKLATLLGVASFS